MEITEFWGEDSGSTWERLASMCRRVHGERVGLAGYFRYHGRRKDLISVVLRDINTSR